MKSKSYAPFYICKVIDKKCSDENIWWKQSLFSSWKEIYGLSILEKLFENLNKCTVEYKLVTKKSIYLTYERVFYTSVAVEMINSGKFIIDLTDYLWLSDCI